MRAKEYALRYTQAEDKKKELVQVVRDMIVEYGELIKKRGSLNKESIKSTFRELLDKWAAFRRIVKDDTIREDAIERYIRFSLPEVYSMHIMYGICKPVVEEKEEVS